jgi:hypothetical protein
VARYRDEVAGLAPPSDETARTYRDVIGYGATLAKEIDEQRDLEKRPHLEAGRTIDATYKPLVVECETIQKALKLRLQTFISAREAEARRKAQEAIDAARSILRDGAFGAAGAEIVIEQFLEGEEVSILAFCDGNTAVGMPPVQDHKRALDGDHGLNTGGMGAYAPTPLISSYEYAECMAIVKVCMTG